MAAYSAAQAFRGRTREHELRISTLAICLFSVACDPLLADESVGAPDEPPNKPERELTPEQLRLFDELMAKEKRGFVLPPHDPESLKEQPVYSGEWIERGGDRICDGYLTRFEDEDFCSAEIPGDWEPFEFEGTTFYVQPLSNEDH